MIQRTALLALLMLLSAVPATTLAGGDGDASPRLGVAVEEEAGGLRVTGVEDGSAAAAGGIEPGDLLLLAGARPLRSVSDIRDELDDARTLVLVFERDGARGAALVDLANPDDSRLLLPPGRDSAGEGPRHMMSGGSDNPSRPHAGGLMGGQAGIGALAPLLEGALASARGLFDRMGQAVPELRDARGFMAFEAYLLDSDGHAMALRGVLGDVVRIEDDHVIVRPNGTDTEHTYHVTATTLVVRGLGEGAVSDLAPDTRVFLLAAGEQDEIRVAAIMGGDMSGGLSRFLPFLAGASGLGDGDMRPHR